MPALMSVVEDLLAGPGQTGRGWWPRASTWLLRVDLEEAVDAYWQLRNPTVVQASTRAKLLMLGPPLDTTTVRLARATWSGLSRAGHRYSYDLQPTAAEIRSWLVDVTNVRDQLGRASA